MTYSTDRHFERRDIPRTLQKLVYARHGRELMRLKSLYVQS
jgi:hypothetical protein